MKEIGFTKEGKYYVHPDTEFFVEFLSGPLCIDEYPIKDITELGFSTGMLRIISPTESVKDRLIAFFHWKDFQSLKQAVLISKNQKIDLKNIEDWSKKEGKLKDFLEFKKRLT